MPKFLPQFLPMATLIALGLITISSAIAQNDKGNEMSTDQKNVLSTIEQMTTAFNNSDIEGIMATYADNATVMFEPGKPVSDPTVLRKMFQGAFALNPKYSFSGHEVIISNDTAVHITPWTMTGRTPDGVDINQSGLSVAVLHRQNDGKWLMVIDNPHGQILMNR